MLAIDKFQVMICQVRVLEARNTLKTQDLNLIQALRVSLRKSKLDRDREQSPAGYDQADQHFQNGDNPFIPPNISDWELDLVVSGVLTRCCSSDI